MVESEGTYKFTDDKLFTHATVGSKANDGAYMVITLTETRLILESLLSNKTLEFEKK
jgi:hypothetical protein